MEARARVGADALVRPAEQKLRSNLPSGVWRASLARPDEGVRAYAPPIRAYVVLAKTLPFEAKKRQNLVRPFAVLCAKLCQKRRMQS